MTAEELASRITVKELDEWAALSRLEHEESDKRERIARVEQQAKVNRRKA